mgnify:CR=1 FL=1
MMWCEESEGTERQEECKKKIKRRAATYIAKIIDIIITIVVVVKLRQRKSWMLSRGPAGVAP